MVIKGYRVWPLLRKTGEEILEDRVLGLAAQNAYYFFFSLFPLLLFLAPLLSLIGDKEEMFGWLMEQLSTTVPPDALNLLEGALEEVVFVEGAPGLMSVGIVLALWTGSLVFNSLIDALNRAFECAETRPFYKKRAVAILAAIVAGAVVLTTSVVMLAGPRIVALIGDYIELPAQTTLIWQILQFPIALTLLVGTLWLLYWFLPAVRGKNKWHVLVGALTAATLWVIVTLGFRYYVSSFGDFNRTYGTIGGVIVLLMWMYLTMLVILVGGELAAELDKGTGAIRPRAGATYTGRLSTAEGPIRSSTERIVKVGT
ncbi:MAG TPA: YihY/virulence factor BrkB family protein [Gemmatimonadaceae bacterium]|nr:YihY/virulence factor BrkB family protein [Gemmatimonadaceae bacterium]